MTTATDNPPNETWHHLPAETVIGDIQSHRERGLDAAEAARRQQQYGPNVVTAQRGHGPLVRFLLQFHQPLIYVLLVATVVTLLLQEYVDAGVIFGVVLVNAFVGFIQEAKALKAIDALAQTLTTEATVIRGGAKLRVSSAGLVPGDVVLLQSGDKTPADLRLFRCRDLQIAEAALTGESVPVEKSPNEVSADTVLGDRKNMAYASTLVTYGQGSGVVVAIGDNTEVGRISQLIASAEDLQTPLTRKIAEFSNLLVVAILALAALNFLLGWLRGFSEEGTSLHDTFLASVALAVAAIPEGLPAAVTITLAIGVARMARRRAIIRKLPAVETLGSTTVICSDKTGTLTENQMTVTALVAGAERFAVTGVGYDPQGAIHTAARTEGGSDQAGAKLSTADLHGHVALLACVRAGLLCNDAVLTQEDGRWTIQGDPTEGALVVVAAKAGLDAHGMLEQLPRIDTLPFESQHQYMATLHDREAGQPRLVYLKGSVEAVLQRCETALDRAGQAHTLDRQKVLDEVDALAQRGLRVLAFAQTEVASDAVSVNHGDVARGMTFVGLQAMIDPPRAEAKVAIAACQSAGILVKMITGDHALTAAAIAEQLGLEDGADAAAGRAPGQLAALTGQELAALSDEQLAETVEQTAVFARVAPEQKLRLVKALQGRGHVAAMTGDGVNDAPALKQADIGVAMGRSGTDVAREASDMVLTDDNFASIEAAVEEGRGVFDNLTKFIVWTLPTNGGEGLLVLAAVVTGMTLPLAPVQILWINMTTAVCLGLMLAFEPKEPGIMQRPPRHPRSPILRPGLIMRVGFVSLFLLGGSFGLFYWMYRLRETSIEEARTVAVNVFVMGELFYLFNCRSLTRSMFAIGVFTNRWILAGVGTMIVLQLLFTYAGPMNFLFQSAPIAWDAWLAILGFGLVVYVAVEIEKRLVGYTLQGETLRRGLR